MFLGWQSCSILLSPSVASSVPGNVGVGETGVGWGKFWLGQCPSVPNELPDGETNYVLESR